MMDNSKRQVRNSNIELLRIICMIIIIASHYASHGEFNFAPEITSFNKTLINCLRIGGKVGVNCFVMIFAYFQINKDMRVNKVIKLCAQVWCYVVLMCIIKMLCGYYSEGFYDSDKLILPICKNISWFATIYIVVYILSPYLNKGLKSLSKKEYQGLIAAEVLLWILPSSILGQNLGSNALTHFFMFYTIGAYMKLYSSKVSENCKLGIYMTVIGLILCLEYISIICCENFDNYEGAIINITNANSITIVILSIGMFITFKNLKIKYNKVINIVASTVFGIYLFHDNEIIRSVLWSDVIKPNLYQESKFLWLHMLVVVATIFIIGMIIEFIRINTVEKIFMKAENKIELKIRNKYINKYKEMRRFLEKNL